MQSKWITAVLFLFISLGSDRVAIPQVAAAQLASGAVTVSRLDELAGKWEIASNLLSLPALNNSLGSGKATWDAVGIGSLSFPPITMTGDTGSLLIDGQAPVLMQARWFAYQVLRRA
ncbi:MAG TPA: hypothetical protein VNV43_03100, partial [Candidatus Acidoferrales bacterium]|nr:hypothetical protein [Candidatus Acidoferrales bacterium]